MISMEEIKNLKNQISSKDKEIEECKCKLDKDKVLIKELKQKVKKHEEQTLELDKKQEETKALAKHQLEKRSRYHTLFCDVFESCENLSNKTFSRMSKVKAALAREIQETEAQDKEAADKIANEIQCLHRDDSIGKFVVAHSQPRPKGIFAWLLRCPSRNHVPVSVHRTSEVLLSDLSNSILKLLKKNAKELHLVNIFDRLFVGYVRGLYETRFQSLGKDDREHESQSLEFVKHLLLLEAKRQLLKSKHDRTKMSVSTDIKALLDQAGWELNSEGDTIKLSLDDLFMKYLLAADPEASDGGMREQNMAKHKFIDLTKVSKRIMNIFCLSASGIAKDADRNKISW